MFLRWISVKSQEIKDGVNIITGTRVAVFAQEIRAAEIVIAAIFGKEIGVGKAVILNRIMFRNDSVTGIRAEVETEAIGKVVLVGIRDIINAVGQAGVDDSRSNLRTVLQVNGGCPVTLQAEPENSDDHPVPCVGGIRRNVVFPSDS